MTTTQHHMKQNQLLIVGVLSILTAVLMIAWLGGMTLPAITDDRGAFSALVILGLALCASGPGIDLKVSQWGRSPMSLFGLVLGLLALGLIGAQVFGISLPLATTTREAFTALSIIIIVKWLVGAAVLLRPQAAR